MAVMCQYPCFAYLPQRGVQEALYLAFDFCNEIRPLWQTIRPGPWRTFGGGLILSLDLKQAYDRLPREYLAKGLDMCGCPLELSTVLLHWLHQAQYHVRHRGLEGSLTPERGVRQGCKASPIEWTAFLIYACQCIGTSVTNGSHEEAFACV